MRLLDKNTVLKEYPISTSKFGLGCEEGSYKTPLGEFSIERKIGEGAEEGTVFKGRKPTGVWKPGDPTETDMILSRIMWLTGCEEHNCNTHDRYVYIHGTNDEELIGTQASHGCVRMRNHDIIELFDLIEEGVRVQIEDSPLRRY